MAATSTLLGLGSNPLSATEANSSVLVYSEPDRVSALEAAVQVQKTWREDRVFSVKLVYDALTGASANGALRTNRPQTFTRPSGNGSYSIGPNETPLDDTFHDTRFALDASVAMPLSRAVKTTLGVTFSNEFDYRAMGLNGRISRDFNQKNTTLTGGVSVSFDIIDPEGGVPVPLVSMQSPENVQPKQEGSRDKTVTDLLFGVTQIVNRSTLMQFNYSYSRASGYLTDPYKIISLVEDRPSSQALGDPTGEYLYENRPEHRTKQSLYWKGKHQLGHAIIDGDYRFLWDDWGLRSHTAQVSYRQPWGVRTHLTPEFRYYHQSAVDFFTRDLKASQPRPRLATADYRQGEFDAITVALNYNRQLNASQTMNVRLGYYLQMGDSSPPDAIGSQIGQDLFPSVSALMLQFGYGRTW